MKLMLRNSSGETVSVFVHPDETFEDLKRRVQLEVGVSLDLQDLTVKGRPVTDDLRVVDYFFKPNCPKVIESTAVVESEPEACGRCVVPTCPNTRRACPAKAFFPFPQDELRCHQWLLYCRRMGEACGAPDVRVSLLPESVVCADHFRKDQFVKNTTTLLKRMAVPCVTTTTSQSPTTPSPAGAQCQQAAGAFEGKETFCRLCSQICKDSILIFDDAGMKLGIADKINSCLPVIVQETDPLPKQLCHSCYERLLVCHSFSQTTLEADKKLWSTIEEKCLRTERIAETDIPDLTLRKIMPLTNSEDQLNNSSTLHDLREENHFYSCPLCTCGKMITKSGVYKRSLPCSSSTPQEPAEDNTGSVLSNLQVMPQDIDMKDTEDSPTVNVDNPSLGENKSYSSKNLLIGDDYSFKIPDLDLPTLYTDPSSLIGMQLESIAEMSWEELENMRNICGKFVASKGEEVVSKGEEASSVCRFCGVGFFDQSSLLKHSAEHWESGRFACPSCDQWFGTQPELDAHFVCSHCTLNDEEIWNILQCECCFAEFSSLFELQNHTCTVSIGGAHKCVNCQKAFRSEARLAFHRQFHEGARPNYCGECDKMFPDELRLYKHVTYSHSQDKEYCCEECGKVFRSSSSLRYHQRAHGGEAVEKPHRCEHCGKCFIRKSMLRNHFVQTHKGKCREVSVFSCKVCLEAFPTTDRAVDHMDTTHVSECQGETTYSFEMHIVKRLYCCEHCKSCFTEVAHLNSHREQHSSALSYQCKMCDNAFSTFQSLSDHQKTHSGLTDCAEKFLIPTVYVCEFCERQFASGVKLSEHQTVHFGEQPYQCGSCLVKFKTRESFTEHRLSCSPVVGEEEWCQWRPFECHFCHKSFSLEDALVKHVRMHTGEKPYVCDQCGKAFSQSSGLYTHQKVHSDERPYSCPDCPRTFKIKGDRDVHVRKHSGVRPYVCAVCGKAFMTQHVYAQHARIHTGERPYQCDVCGVAFRRSHVLTVHKRIHTGEKPNVCELCGKRYRQKGDLLKHRRIQHGAAKAGKSQRKGGSEM